MKIHSFVFVCIVFSLLSFGLVQHANAVACVPNSSCTMSNGCPGYMSCYLPPLQGGNCLQLPNCNLGGGGGGGGGGGSGCSYVSCEGKKCGEQVSSGQAGCPSTICEGHCDDSSKTCQYVNGLYACLALDKYECKDPDNTTEAFNETSFLTKTSVVRTNLTTGKSTPSTDRCVAKEYNTGSKYIEEAYCDKDGNAKYTPPQKCPADKPFCDESVAKGVCIECRADYDCGDARSGKKCNQETHECETPCVPTKTCADYKGQCGRFFNDGCNNFALDCSNNCPKKQYCDFAKGECVKQPPKNCCAVVYGFSSPEKEIACNNNKKKLSCQKYLGGHGDCIWDEKEKKCHDGTFFPLMELAGVQPKCQVTERIFDDDNYDDTIQKTEVFLNNQNCKTVRIFLRKHGTENDCNPMFQMLSVCATCTDGNCNLISLTAKSCSVLNKREQVDMLAEKLQKKLTNQTVILEGDQAVASDCRRTPRKLVITKDSINSDALECDRLFSYNNDNVYQDDGGCFGNSTNSAKGQVIECKGADNVKSFARCCPVYDGSKKWNWMPVNFDNPVCNFSPADILCENIENKTCYGDGKLLFGTEKAFCKAGNSTKTLMCCSTNKLLPTLFKWKIVDANNPQCPAAGATAVESGPVKKFVTIISTSAAGIFNAIWNFIIRIFFGK